jgi:hypothetical protein
MSNNRLSSIADHINTSHSFVEEPHHIKLECMIVQDAKEDVNKLYRRVSKGYSDANSMDKMFYGLNDELKKNIDKLKNKMTADHTNIL